MPPRDAALIAVLAYTGVRPGEALALRWRDVGERTILVERALDVDGEKDTKTTAHRTVRLLAPLAADLREWRMASAVPATTRSCSQGRTGGHGPSPRTSRGGVERPAAGRRSAGPAGFARACEAAGVVTHPYALRHSFASLLLHEGRSLPYVARQLGHSPRVCLDTYSHVIDELEDAPRVSAEDAIRAARGTSGTHSVPNAVTAGA